MSKSALQVTWICFINSINITINCKHVDPEEGKNGAHICLGPIVHEILFRNIIPLNLQRVNICIYFWLPIILFPPLHLSTSPPDESCCKAETASQFGSCNPCSQSQYAPTSENQLRLHQSMNKEPVRKSSSNSTTIRDSVPWQRLLTLAIILSASMPDSSSLQVIQWIPFLLNSARLGFCCLPLRTQPDPPYNNLSFGRSIIILLYNQDNAALRSLVIFPRSHRL